MENIDEFSEEDIKFLKLLKKNNIPVSDESINLIEYVNKNDLSFMDAKGILLK